MQPEGCQKQGARSLHVAMPHGAGRTPQRAQDTPRGPHQGEEKAAGPRQKWKKCWAPPGELQEAGVPDSGTAAQGTGAATAGTTTIGENTASWAESPGQGEKELPTVAPACQLA